MRWSSILLVLTGLWLAGCSKAKQSEDAVKAGLMEYLKTRAGLDVNSMDIRVTSVTFRGSEADAAVSFHAKGASDASQGMNMKYVLEQKGTQWVVKGRSGKSEHGGPSQSTLPPGHPETPAAPVGGGEAKQ